MSRRRCVGVRCADRAALHLGAGMLATTFPGVAITNAALHLLFLVAGDAILSSALGAVRRVVAGRQGWDLRGWRSADELILHSRARLLAALSLRVTITPAAAHLLLLMAIGASRTWARGGALGVDVTRCGGGERGLWRRAHGHALHNGAGMLATLLRRVAVPLAALHLRFLLTCAATALARAFYVARQESRDWWVQWSTDRASLHDGADLRATVLLRETIAPATLHLFLIMASCALLTLATAASAEVARFRGWDCRWRRRRTTPATM
mmetsp:Transcript_10443/g.22095  ORF Transcript_10443/g.22095 Transcript_10443/m.22095 type:complete len:267 (+) Transcript_10443:258-1058(+)